MSTAFSKSQPKIGPYRLEQRIGQGGMAVVYKAWDEQHQRWVALKFLRMEQVDEQEAYILRKRFEREIKTLMRLRHPAIVPVLDAGVYRGRPYLVMPYYARGTLKDHLTRRPIPWRQAIRFILPLLDALAYAHAHGVVHRDLKPSNILIADDGGPVLGDFGIVALASTQHLTRSGQALGTPEYMAPEQALGRPVDPRTDIYALGCVLYEMLSGRPPYTADTPVALLMQHVQAEVPRLSKRVPGIPKSVEKVLRRALAKKPQDRYPHVQAFKEALVDLLRQGATSRRVALMGAVRGLGALLLLLVLGLSVAWAQHLWGGAHFTPTVTPSSTPQAAPLMQGGASGPTATPSRTPSPSRIPAVALTPSGTPTMTPLPTSTFTPTYYWVPPTNTPRRPRRKTPTPRPPTLTPTPTPTPPWPITPTASFTPTPTPVPPTPTSVPPTATFTPPPEPPTPTPPPPPPPSSTPSTFTYSLPWI